MRSYKLNIWMVMIAGVLAMPLFAGSSFADKHSKMDEDMHEKMMQQRGGGMGMGRGGMMGGGMMGGGMMGGGMMGGGMMGGGMMGGGMMGGGMMGDGMTGGGMMGGDMSPMMMRMLDLDDKQRARIQDIAREQRTNRCKMMNEMMDIRDEMMVAYGKSEPDSKAIGKLYGKMFEKKRQMLEQSIDTRNKLRGVLNKEQKESFDQMHRGGGMMGGGMGMMDMMQ